jgi:predicted transposase YdaD
VNGGIFGYSVIIRKHLKNIIMAATDSPLKRLVTTFIDDFATWLLESEVDSVTPHNIELYAKPDPVRADEVFTVKLASGRTIILHIEFQGRRSEIPMPLRELDSLSRLALKFQDMELYSVVFYVGKGAGQDDTGIHEITNPKGEITLNWQYKVIRLWFRGFSFFFKKLKPRK